MHRNRSTFTLRVLLVATALLLACSSSDDVVAEVAAPASLPSTAGVIVSGGGTVAGTSMSTGAVALPAPIAVPANLPSSGAGIPAPAGTVQVAGTLRSLASDDAEPWPLPMPLREMFGTPDPNRPRRYQDVSDPIDAEALRQLGRRHGLVPGGPPVLIIVVDDLADQCDLSILEGG